MPPHEHTGAGSPRGLVILVGEGSAPSRCRQRVEQQADVQACAARRTAAVLMAALTTGTGSCAHRAMARSPLRSPRSVPPNAPATMAKPCAKRRVRSCLVSPMMSKSAWSDPAARPTRPAPESVPPAMPLLRPPRREDAAAAGAGRRRPTPRASPRATIPPPGGDWACSRRTRRGARSSSPRRIHVLCRAPPGHAVRAPSLRRGARHGGRGAARSILAQGGSALHREILSQRREPSTVDDDGLPGDVASPFPRRNTTTGAMSVSGSPIRPSGTTRARRGCSSGFSRYALSSAGVRANGDRHTTPTPRGPHSTARLRARPRTAPFTAA